VARIFNTSGSRMQIDDGRVISNFIVQALRKEPISIYGDGQQTRVLQRGRTRPLWRNVNQLAHDDPTGRCLNIGLAKRQLGWQPVVPLQEGLRKSIEYFDCVLG
jgi:UDP-glucuronate decarboxylase